MKERSKGISGCDIEGESCSLGGDEWRRDLGWPEAFGIFGNLIDGFNIGCCAWLVYQLVCGWARSAVNEAVGFSIGSLSTTLEPPSPLCGFNRIRWKPDFCFSGTRSMTSFQSAAVSKRDVISLYLVCITVSSRVRVWEERRWQNVLFEKVKINVFYVSILICSLGEICSVLMLG